MSDRLQSIEAFVLVVERGSFSAAARAIGVAQPSVSKLVARLERDLDARLLNRTTRHVTPTQAGRTFYQRAKVFLAGLDDARKEVQFGGSELHGRLRVNTSVMLAVALVQEAMLAFGHDHPHVQLELEVDDKLIDPVERDADLIVRTGRTPESSLRAKRAGYTTAGFFASPGYLAATAAPLETMSDLARHPFISLLDRPPTSRRNARPVAGGIAVGNTVVAREAVLAGAGVAALPSVLVHTDLEAGRLVQVLKSAVLPKTEIRFLHAFGPSAPRQITAFIDFAIKRWRSSDRLV